jgi:hypothetical protein
MESTQQTFSGRDNEALAARLEITFDGKRYAYRQYRYDHFDDAMRYALASQARRDFVPDEAFQPQWNTPFCPTADDVQRMKPFGITYSDGYYHFGNYRYDQLGFAIAYALQHTKG